MGCIVHTVASLLVYQPKTVADEILYKVAKAKIYKHSIMTRGPAFILLNGETTHIS